VDPETENGKSPAMSIDRSTQVKPPYNVMPYTTIYPNSLDNMKTEVSAVGYANQGAIPQWMLNQQEDGRVLGFTRGVVLAYTVPGASKLIAYRLSQTDNDFNDVDFVADRYQLDNYLSTNFDIAAQAFIPSKETTFDRFPSTSDLHPYAGAVDFAVTVPFDQINGRTIEYLVCAGGLDGSIPANGQLIVFAKQELFESTEGYAKDLFDVNTFDSLGFDLSVVPQQYSTDNDGWNVDNGLYGSNLYGSTPYAPTSVVPGFLDNLLNPEIQNMRGGIWRIEIADDTVVTLVFVSEVERNEYVQVAGGASYGGTKLYYDPIVKAGHSVPEYSILTSISNSSMGSTEFDSGATRFFNNRDVYAAPETNDIYLKFPKFDVYR